jgi:flagellar biosynthesis/type III secretory pathway protein FliH
MEDDNSYQDGYDVGFIDGNKDGYNIGYAEGLEEAEERTTSVLNSEWEDRTERLRELFHERLTELNSQIRTHQQQIFELRKAHATTTRVVSESTE